MEHQAHSDNFVYNFMPHGHCYLWDSNILWIQVVSNSLIALAYFMIPIALIYFTKKRKDVVFRGIFILFCIFIISCGFSHILDIIVIWKPYYWLDSIVRVITAIASISTAIALIPLIPKAISLPSPSQLEKEIEEKKIIEQELKKAHLELESKVEERTLDLLKANELLKQEIIERERVEIALKENERKFIFLTDNLPQIIWSADPQGELDYYNKNWFEYTGMTLEQTKGWGWEPVLHPDDLVKTIETWTDSFTNGKPYEIEYRFKRVSDGQYRWHLGRALPFINENGEIIKWFGTCTDIHNQKLDKELMQIQKEELERFTYINSHDLQEPLRSITSFTQLLKRRYKNNFDIEANNYMDVIIQSSLKMKEQINSFIDYIRISSEKIEHQDVDFNQVISDVIDNLELSIEESGAIIEYSSLPIIRSDYRMMYQLFYNIVTNSIKFQNEKPVIKISAERQNSEWIFSISDNGIGIDQAFFEKVFVIFQRLNGRGKYKGSGVGLTISKKIIDFHEGRIWIESNINNGITVYFSLPVR